MDKNVYITYLPFNEMLGNIIALHYSYQKTLSAYPFIVMCASNITQETLNTLEELNIEYLIIPEEYQFFDQWNNDKNITYPFNLTQYDKIIYVHKDSIFIKNMDRVFDFPDFPFFWNWPNDDEEKRIKSTWYACVPNQQIFNAILEYYQEDSSSNSEETLYKVFEDYPEYEKTLITFPAFADYLYYFPANSAIFSNKTTNEIHNEVDNLLNDKFTIAQFQYYYLRYPIKFIIDTDIFFNFVKRTDY